MAIIPINIHPSTFNPDVPIIWKHILNQLPRCYPASSSSSGSQRLSKNAQCRQKTKQKTLAEIKRWRLGPSQLQGLPQLPCTFFSNCDSSWSGTCVSEPCCTISRVETCLHFSFGYSRRLQDKASVGPFCGFCLRLRGVTLCLWSLNRRHDVYKDL